MEWAPQHFIESNHIKTIIMPGISGIDKICTLNEIVSEAGAVKTLKRTNCQDVLVILFRYEDSNHFRF